MFSHEVSKRLNRVHSRELTKSKGRPYMSSKGLSKDGASGVH